MIGLILLASCSREPPLHEWRGCVQEGVRLEIVSGPTLMYAEDRFADRDVLTVGASWSSVLFRMSSGLHIELPHDLQPDEPVDLSSTPALYVRSPGRRTVFGTRVLTGTLQLVATDGDIERYAVDATAADPELRDEGQPEAVELAGEVTVRRTSSPTCRPP